ncbi:MAG: AI-2E family transporter, partial [Clostridia bacterium]|nr:AI-2E family transporter [Clostridia bacterium]
MDKKVFRSIALLLLIAAVLALAVIKFDWIIGTIQLLFSVMTPIIAGVLIAVFLDRPFVLFRKLFLKLFKKAKHRHKLSSALSVTITYLLLLAFIAVFLVSVIPEVTASVTNLIANINSYVSNVENALNEIIEKYDVLKDNLEPLDFSGWGQWITQKIQSIQDRLPEIFNITKSIAGGLANTVLSIIISIYIMLGRNHLKWQAKKVIYA